jgi:Holliday junction resolvasome RuvABC endonuclease subunit
MNILSIDPGINTGFATLINGQIRSGVQCMKSKSNESAGMKYLRFDSWLNEMQGIGDFNLIVYEKAHHLQGNAIESMNGFITGIQRYCAVHPIEYKAVSPGEIKKFATGKGNAKKPDMVAWFKQYAGRDPVADDEADALALLLFIRKELGL